jgi:predicted amidohydrolase
VRELAAVHRTTIAFGMLERGERGARYDSLVVVGPDDAVTSYRKTHLYPLERPHFSAGDRLVVVPCDGVLVGPLICFEHAFPEIASTLARRGAQLLAIASAVPVGYEHLLELRSRARAQDNQVFVVAANLTGGAFCGRSLIVDPRGDVLARAGADEEIVRARIDVAAVTAEREREPALRLRRPALYA